MADAAAITPISNMLSDKSQVPAARTLYSQFGSTSVENYRISGNFRAVKFACFIISCHNIFVDWVTHEIIFTATSLTRREKSYKGLAARLPRLFGTL